MVTVLSTTQGLGHGAETVLCEMLGAWPGDDGMPLRIAAPRGSRVIACAAKRGFATVPLASRHDALADNATAVLRAFGRNDDLSLVHAWSARGFELAWFLKFRFGIPASGTLHDHPQACFHGVSRKLIMKWAANRLDGLVVVSRAVADAVAESSWEVPTTTVKNGIRALPVPRSTPAAKTRIGFLGMNAPGKGIRLVCDWIRETASDDNITWHLYGDVYPGAGRILDALPAYCRAKCNFKGRRAPEKIFSEIDLLLHASTAFDSLPTVLIEAARAGIPCVASSLGGAPEIVDHGKTGFLFDPSSPQEGLAALTNLVADTNLRFAMGTASRRRFEDHFDADGMAAGYQRFWAQLLEKQMDKG